MKEREESRAAVAPAVTDEEIRRAAILDALGMIQDECRSHADGCEACPFYNDSSGLIVNRCRVTSSNPSLWRLGESVARWRAFEAVPRIVFEEEPEEEDKQ